jgi:hypothetical protein
MKRSSNLPVFICWLTIFAVLTCCTKKEYENKLPSLITVPASGITTNSAILGGIIGNDGGNAITSRGVCWGLDPHPEVSSNMKNMSGKGAGLYTCLVDKLIPDKLYYVTAYATNSEGTAYGGEVTFKTMPGIPPTVVTIPPDQTFLMSAYYCIPVGIYIEDPGTSDIFEKGICWATTENPTVIENDKNVCNSDDEPDRDGYYWVFIEPLKPKTHYHARAYADNGVAVSYGEDFTFTTRAVPEVTTFKATEISRTTSMVGGDLTSFGDVIIYWLGDIYYWCDEFEVGICYGKHTKPSINGLHIKADTLDIGEFTCNLTNLTPGTFYYARAYVRWNDAWGHFDAYTEYGNEVTFETKP